MLIVQIFSVISVYCLCGGQYAYKGNIINFPQDVHKFTTQLPRHPSSLDVLKYVSILQMDQHSETLMKSAQALFWLKMNNHYYEHCHRYSIMKRCNHYISENGTIDDYLSHVLRNEDHLNNNQNDNEDIIGRSFVLVAPSSHCEDDSINEVVARMQEKTTPIVWPNIDSNPINEFNTPGYITRAFPTLYPYGKPTFVKTCKRCKACRVFPTLA